MKELLLREKKKKKILLIFEYNCEKKLSTIFLNFVNARVMRPGNYMKKIFTQMFDCHGIFKGKNSMIVKKNSSLNTIFIYMYLSKALLNCLVI